MAKPIASATTTNIIGPTKIQCQIFISFSPKATDLENDSKTHWQRYERSWSSKSGYVVAHRGWRDQAVL